MNITRKNLLNTIEDNKTKLPILLKYVEGVKNKGENKKTISFKSAKHQTKEKSFRYPGLKNY
ncbi:MAG: hypothetical protein EOM29_03660 [Bacteroidia bacterium]|nr:hypothetical protein [Bacteroidia bacterium]